MENSQHPGDDQGQENICTGFSRAQRESSVWGGSACESCFFEGKSDSQSSPETLTSGTTRRGTAMCFGKEGTRVFLAWPMQH